MIPNPIPIPEKFRHAFAQIQDLAELEHIERHTYDMIRRDMEGTIPPPESGDFLATKIFPPNSPQAPSLTQ